MTQIELIKQHIKYLDSKLIRGGCAAQIVMETNCKSEAYKEVLAFIESLEKGNVGQLGKDGPIVEFVDAPESLEKGQPQGLDEAANEYANSHTVYIDVEGNAIAYRSFKAGAEWIVEQGETYEGTIDNTMGYPTKITLHTYLTSRHTGDKVIVQIRKK